jgi:hypothetical protein
MKIPAMARFLLFIAFLFLLPTPMPAQSSAEDSMLYKKSVQYLINIYHRSSGDQSALYNGSEYATYPFSFSGGGYPFYKENMPGTGSVVYDGILYEDVKLQYDEVQEILFMQDSIRRIQLLNQRITGFALFNNSFIRIVKDSMNRVLVRTGFYNLLYKGNTSLLKKEEKRIREEVATGELQRFIDVVNYYYLQKNNTCYSIKNKGSIMDIFKDRKKDIRQYIRKNKLSYRKDRDNMLIKVTAYYDQLIK